MRKGVCSRITLQTNIKRKREKYEKLAKKAGLPFDVKVLTKVKSLIYILLLKDLVWPASG